MRTVPLGPSVELPLGPRNAVPGEWQCQIKCVGGTHADGGTGAFRGALHGATMRCTGYVKMPNLMFRDACGRWHWGSVELPTRTRIL
eukprot:8636901-Pyramimonas_sp.AAC.1